MLLLALFLPFLYSGWYFFSMWQSCLATQLIKLHAFANFRYTKLILFLILSRIPYSILTDAIIF